MMVALFSVSVNIFFPRGAYPGHPFGHAEKLKISWPKAAKYRHDSPEKKIIFEALVTGEEEPRPVLCGCCDKRAQKQYG